MRSSRRQGGAWADGGVEARGPEPCSRRESWEPPGGQAWRRTGEFYTRGRGAAEDGDAAPHAVTPGVSRCGRPEPVARDELAPSPTVGWRDRSHRRRPGGNGVSSVASPASARHLAVAAVRSSGRGGGWPGVRDDFRNWVMALEDFDDDPEHSGERILEAIQMAWIEERS